MALVFLFSLKQVSKFFVVFLFEVTILCQKAQGKPYKILHQMKVGYHVNVHVLAKHIVSLRYGDDGGVFGLNHYCSGTIISERVILTNAHCILNKSGYVYNKENLKVVAGITHRLEQSEFMRIHKVKKILPYSHYDPRIVMGDIALLYLTEPLEEDGNYIQRIPLTEMKPKPGQMCMTYGWGAVLPKGPKLDELLYVNVTIFHPRACLVNFKLTNGVICAGIKDGLGMDVGDGDSGSPLVCDGKLVGIVSYSTEQFLLSFYVDVWFYRDWIRSNEAISSWKSSLWILLFINLMLFASFQ